VPTKSALMEGIKRTNAVMVHPNQRAGFTPCSPYAIDMNKRNINCYNYGRFEHLARNCKNRGIGNRIGG